MNLENNDNTEKIREMQILEHNIQNILMQKQALNLELNEVQNAIEEVSSTSGEIFKITGQIMVKAEKEKTLSELDEKKKILNIRSNAIDKQEKLLLSKAEELKSEIQNNLSARDK